MLPAPAYKSVFPDIASLSNDIIVLSKEVAETLRKKIPLKVFADAMSTMPSCVVLCEADPHKTIFFANDAFIQMTGHTRDDIVGKSCEPFVDHLRIIPIMDLEGQPYAFVGIPHN